MSVISTGCVVWLQRFQPVFAFIAIAALAYQAWLVWRRPRRTTMMLAILWASLGTAAGLGTTMVVLWQRYR